MNPLVTVYIPVYNGEKYIAEAINSVLGQSYTRFELIVVNDGSTDNTLQVLSGFTDERIRIIDLKENRGNCAASNVALKQAKGKYIARMDADDVSLPQRIEKQVAYMESHPDVLLSGAFLQLMNEEGQLSENVWKYYVQDNDIKIDFLFRSGVIQGVSILRRNEVVCDFELFYDETNKASYAEDFDFFYRISKIGKLGNISEILLHYRRHEENITKKLKTRAAELKAGNFKKVLLDFSFNEGEIDMDSHLFLAGLNTSRLNREKLKAVKKWYDILTGKLKENGTLTDKDIERIILPYWQRLFYRLCNSSFILPFVHMQLDKTFSFSKTVYIIKKRLVNR
ncbi:MAG: glycosyltransferase family 2 protein [Flavobacteriales bacterium]